MTTTQTMTVEQAKAIRDAFGPCTSIYESTGAPEDIVTMYEESREMDIEDELPGQSVQEWTETQLVVERIHCEECGISQTTINCIEARIRRDLIQAGVLATPPILPGAGATLVYPQDRYPYVVTRVTAKTITVERVCTEGLEPEGYCNGFPVINHTFSAEELQGRRMGGADTAHLRKDKRYYLGGTYLAVGSAVYYRNFAE